MKSWDTFLFEAKFMGQRAVGKKIKLKRESQFSWYFEDVNNAVGIILSYNQGRTYKYHVRFEMVKDGFGQEFDINYADFEILADDYKLPKPRVRWYRHGKLHEEGWEE